MNKTIHSAIKSRALTPRSRTQPDKSIPWVKRLLQTGRWLSLDVALGAVFSCAMVCRSMHVTPVPWLQLLVLGGVVLLIYTLDHLWDVHHMSKVPVTDRHFFHWRYEQELRWFAAVLFIVLCIAAFLVLAPEVFYFGLFLGTTVAIYLWLVNNLPKHKTNQWFLKEFFIAGIYTAGIWGSVWVEAGVVKPVQYLLAVLFGIIALLNLLLFSCYELEEDIMQAQRSAVTAWGKNRVNAACILLFFLFSITAIFLSYHHQQKIEGKVLFVECLMAAVLLLLFAFPAFFRKKHRYRWIGDGIFLFPAFIWI